MEENKAEERTAREPMTKRTDTSRSTDSGVSGNAQTGAREIRLSNLMPFWMFRWRAEYCLIKAIFKSSGWNLIDDLDTIWMLRPWKQRKKGE